MAFNEQDEVKIETDKKTKSRKFSIFQISVAGLVLAVIVAFGIITASVYKSTPSSPIVRSIVKVIPYPVAIVDWDPIGFNDLLVGFDGLMTFYTRQANEIGADIPQEVEIFESLMDNLIREEIIQALASERGIEVDQVKVDALMDKAVQDAGGNVDDLLNLLEKNYGWSAKEFRETVLEPLVLASDLQDWILSDEELQAERKGVAEEALERINNGEEFSSVAMEVSEDPSGMLGGDIGYIRPDEFTEGWSEVLLNLNEGEISGVIEASDVFGILKVDDILEDEGDTQYKVSVIIVAKRNLEDMVNERLLTAKIWKLVKFE